MAGIDAKTISRRLGHENISITYDIYGHIMPGQDENAAGAMDQLMVDFKKTLNTPQTK